MPKGDGIVSTNLVAIVLSLINILTLVIQIKNLMNKLKQIIYKSTWTNEKIYLDL